MTAAPRWTAAVGRRTLLVAALGGATTGLAGCVGLATTGPVLRGGTPGGGDTIPITVYARGPDPGDSPEQIVLGFLDASALPGPAFTAARAYLSAAAARTWDPAASVTIYDGTQLQLIVPESVPTLTPVTSTPVTSSRATSSRATSSPATSSPATSESVVRTTVRVEAPDVGALDRRGGWSAAGSVTLPLTVDLVAVDGQWRIDNPPSGLVVSAADFARIWQSYNLLYPDPGGSVLVADPVYLPDRGTPASSLVEALLGGPSSWLAPVVRRTLPASAGLGARGVAVSAGVATVDLAGVPALGVQGRTLLAAQLVQTLAQVNTPSVDAVSVLLDGLPLAIAGVAAAEPVDSWAKYSADVLTASAGDLSVLRVASAKPATASAKPGKSPPAAARPGTALWRGAPGSLLAVPLPTGLARATRPSWVATDPQSSRMVFTDADQARVFAVSGSSTQTAPVELATGVGLLRPQIDRQGLVWLLDVPGGTPRLRVVGPRGGAAATRTVAVDTGTIPGAQLRRVWLARDGQRAAVVLRSAGADLLLLETVDRSATPRLTGPRYVLGPFAQIIDLTWADAVTILVLVRAADGGVSVFTVDSDGSNSSSLGSVPTDSVSVTAGPDSRPAVVGTSSGVVLVQLDTPPQWKAVDVGYAPVYPG